MSVAIVRGRERAPPPVDFGDAAIEVDVAIGSETVQITVEAVHHRDEQRQPDGRRLVTSND